MAQNPIQIQPGLSLSEFMTKYGTETQCAAALEQSRWPEGFVCARCASARHSMWRRESRSYRQCSHCGYQTSLTAGTIFEATKLPLRLWFLAMHLLSQAKNNVSALELKRHLAVSYPTAFMLKHKLMQVMTQREQARRLDGRVEIDDAYLGGERPGKRGRGSENKIPFIAAVQTNHQGHPLFVRLDRLSTFSHQAIKAWASQALAASAHVLSDGWSGFAVVAKHVALHQPIVVGAGPRAVQRPEFRWVNTILGNLKTAIGGTYHAFNFHKYADRYLGEAQYRFNRRFDLRSILARLTRAAVLTDPWPAKRLKFTEQS
jgi:Zn ribbon nucleic-acid-binding protein